MKINVPAGIARNTMITQDLILHSAALALERNMMTDIDVETLSKNCWCVTQEGADQPPLMHSTTGPGIKRFYCIADHPSVAETRSEDPSQGDAGKTGEVSG